MSEDELLKIFNRYISNTKYKQLIRIKELVIGNIPSSTKYSINSHQTKVRISTIALKHIYDKHVFRNELLDEFKFILTNLRKVIQKPDVVVSNKPKRKANFCFIKTIKNKNILCTIEFADKKLYVVTAFILKDQGYLKGTKLLWKS